MALVELFGVEIEERVFVALFGIEVEVFPPINLFGIEVEINPPLHLSGVEVELDVEYPFVIGFGPRIGQGPYVITGMRSHGPESEVVLPTPEIYAYGDSNTVGFGVVPDSDAYVPRVGTAKGWAVTNRAFSGSKIADAEQIGRILADDLRVHHVILFLTGYNDMRFYGTTSDGLAQYETHLEDALDRFEAVGCDTYIANCLRMPAAAYSMGAPYDQGSDAAVALYNAVIQAQCAAHLQMTYVDVSALVDPTNLALWQADLSHPTSAGHLIIANAILALIP